MSFKAVAKAWSYDSPKMTCLHKLVLIGLAQYADEDGRCWPSQERLSSDCLLCERTIRKILKDLEDHGIIRRVSRSSTDGRRTDIITMFPQPESDAGSATGISCRSDRHLVPVAVIHETINETIKAIPSECPEQTAKPKVTRSRKTHPPVPPPPFPTKEQWVAFCKERWPWFPRQQAEQSFDYYDIRGWHMGNGKEVKNWKSCALTCSSRWAESHESEVKEFRLRRQESESAQKIVPVKPSDVRRSLFDMLKDKEGSKDV